MGVNVETDEVAEGHVDAMVPGFLLSGV